MKLDGRLLAAISIAAATIGVYSDAKASVLLTPGNEYVGSYTLAPAADGGPYVGPLIDYDDFANPTPDLFDLNASWHISWFDSSNHLLGTETATNTLFDTNNIDFGSALIFGAGTNDLSGYFVLTTTDAFTANSFLVGYIDSSFGDFPNDLSGDAVIAQTLFRSSRLSVSQSQLLSRFSVQH